MIRSITIQLLTYFTFACGASAQILSPGIPKGGGSFSDCDSSLVVDFIVQPLGDLQQSFSPVIVPGNTTVLATTWTYLTDTIHQETLGSLEVTYPAPGETPVCLTVNALDQMNFETCSNTVCQFVDILQDPSCSEYVPDFTIGSVQGNTIVFQGSSGADSTTYLWSFGNGTSSASLSPQNTFEGPGPHQVCLTVIGPSPFNCTSTVCKWLYLGNGDLACDQVVMPGFLHFQNENFIVVMDTSIISGQNSSVRWDFGDGAFAEGPIAVHEYDADWNSYELCAQLDVWGPLVADTCELQSCRTILLGGSIAAIGERTLDDLYVSLDRSTDILHLVGPVPQGSSLSIHDATGRLLITHTSISSGNMLSIDIGSLGLGTHILRLTSASGNRSFRFLKL